MPIFIKGQQMHSPGFEPDWFEESGAQNDFSLQKEFQILVTFIVYDKTIIATVP
jgi:hypothetical protein